MESNAQKCEDIHFGLQNRKCFITGVIGSVDAQWNLGVLVCKLLKDKVQVQ